MKIPIKISPCPIIESIIEIRFSTEVPSEAIFGIIYNKFKEEFPILEKLPILQIPDQLRSNDPNLMFKPTHKLSKDNLLIQIGPRVFALVNTHEYIGWEKFSEIIYNVFSKLFNAIKLDKIQRVAVRYINLFKEINIYEESNLKITLDDKPFRDHDINLTSVMHTRNCTHRLAMINKAEVVVNNKHYAGSLIDIDTVLKVCSINTSNDVEIFKNCIAQAHVDEKKLFFSLLKESFLETLSPEY